MTQQQLGCRQKVEGVATENVRVEGVAPENVGVKRKKCTGKENVGVKRKRPVSCAIVSDSPIGVESTGPSRSIVSSDTPVPLSLDRLRNFVLFKAYDVIGSGGYRRFVLKNKNNGESWATVLYNDTQYVSRHVRATLLLVNRLQYTASCVKLHKLCQRVINDLNPPTISTHGWCICALTGMRTENTTQLGRTSKGDACHVHRKFFKFFCMLWFIARIDLCVKYFTMQWLQQHNGGEKQNIQCLCEKLQGDTLYVQNMCDKFAHAVAHVSASVLSHIEHMGQANLLNITA
ncbi:hypothetical protein T484DRAFT_1750306 [Baffinella frigidus]|nr:hypothetical protein T484DRAFT_1750306 [Cryptophyta sp. CCMP2293]